MKIAAIATLVYGFLVLAGGVTGYIHARSVPSLIAGGVCGAALIVAGFYVWQGNVAAAFVSVGLSLLLALFFAYRFSTTGKFVPGGLMLALTFVAVVVLVYGVFMSLRDHP